MDDTKKEKITVVYVYKCDKRLRTNTCTDDHVDLELGGGSYCRWCYKRQQNDLSASKKRSNCNSSGMGCAQCKVPICESCWESGYDHSISRRK